MNRFVGISFKQQWKVDGDGEFVTVSAGDIDSVGLRRVSQYWQNVRFSDGALNQRSFWGFETDVSAVNELDNSGNTVSVLTFNNVKFIEVLQDELDADLFRFGQDDVAAVYGTNSQA